VGITTVDCNRRYGIGNYMRQYASEKGTDRADMDRCFRSPGFVELRADRQGRIVGCTAFGPAAAELTNSMGIAIENMLTVYDIARAPHGYPSHGYLLYRLALSMALSTTFGVLDAFGLKTLSKAAMFLDRRLRGLGIASAQKKRTLEAIGHASTILYNGRILTYIDLHRNVTDQAARHLKLLTKAEAHGFERWSEQYRVYEK
jgi:Pyridine nucleotide-disulphide oxidoreductase, dimerisation domain